MANTDAKFGLRPVRTMGGHNVNANLYTVATDYTTAIYTGDVVELTGLGRNVAKAAAQNPDNIGVFAGCAYTAADGTPTWSMYWPGVSDGKTNIVCYVYDDPNIVFEVQADSCAAIDVSTVVDWNVGTGSATTGLSGLYAVVSGATGTADKGLRILGLSQKQGNDYGAYAKIEVLIIEHVLRPNVAAVGGV